VGPGSAGASTVAVAVATYVQGILLEADADGGVLAARYEGSLDEQAPTVASLLEALPDWPGTVADQFQRLPGGARAAVLPPDAEGAFGPARRLADDLEHLRYRLPGETLVIDTGRLRPESPAMMVAEQSDVFVAVVRPETDSLHCLITRLPTVQAQIPRLMVAVRGDGPYDLTDIRDAVHRRVGRQIAVVGVPEDPSGVSALHRGRTGPWSALTGRASASLMHSARVLTMLLDGPGPGEE